MRGRRRRQEPEQGGQPLQARDDLYYSVRAPLRGTYRGWRERLRVRGVARAAARGGPRGAEGAAPGFVLALACAVLALSAPVAPPAAAAAPTLGECAAGELCLWSRPGFRGDREAYERRRVPFGSCRRLPHGMGADSFANRTGRPVTVYESGECAETAAFHTHPSGSWTPDGSYRVRAFKVWER